MTKRKLTSNEMNEMLRQMEWDKVLPYDAFGGKVVPYIGWFWRDVNFNAPTYNFGILPVFDLVLESNADVKLGFMENNKWDYDYHHCSAKDWKEIRRLLEAALLEQSGESFEAVDNKIQSLYSKEE